MGGNMDYQFTDTEFMTAQEKATVLRAWTRFLRGGLREEQFTKALYYHLSQHCSFIAHYDRAGFYATYFVRPETVRDFLSQFDGRGECLSIECGMSYWRDGEYADLAQAMIAEATPFIPGIVESANRAERESDLALAKRLLAKHGVVQ